MLLFCLERQVREAEGNTWPFRSCRLGDWGACLGLCASPWVNRASWSFQSKVDAKPQGMKGVVTRFLRFFFLILMRPEFILFPFFTFHEIPISLQLFSSFVPAITTWQTPGHPSNLSIVSSMRGLSLLSSLRPSHYNCFHVHPPLSWASSYIS